MPGFSRFERARHRFPEFYEDVNTFNEGSHPSGGPRFSHFKSFDTPSQFPSCSTTAAEAVAAYNRNPLDHSLYNASYPSVRNITEENGGGSGASSVSIINEDTFSSSNVDPANDSSMAGGGAADTTLLSTAMSTDGHPPPPSGTDGHFASVSLSNMQDSVDFDESVGEDYLNVTIVNDTSSSEVAPSTRLDSSTDDTSTNTNITTINTGTTAGPLINSCNFGGDQSLTTGTINVVGLPASGNTSTASALEDVNDATL